MISFLICVGILVAGYFLYGGLVDKTFGVDDRSSCDLQECVILWTAFTAPLYRALAVYRKELP